MSAAVSATPCQQQAWNLNDVPFSVGQPIEVYSKSGGGWVQAKVHSLAPDGTVTVTWGPNMKKIQPHDYQEWLRPVVQVKACNADADPSRGPSHTPGRSVEPASEFTAFGKRPFHLRSGRDLIKCVYYPASHENDGFGARGVIITGGGANGNEPRMEAGPYDLYAKLGRRAPQRFGISVVSVQYRKPNSVKEAAKDLLATLNYIRQASRDAPAPPVLLAGWSMGGAAVVQAVVQFLEQQKNLEESRRLDIRGIVTIAGQPVLDDCRSSSGAALLPLECGLTICHGTADPCVNVQAADMLYNDAVQGPAGRNKPNLDLKKFPGEDHGVASVYDWLMHGRLPQGVTGNGNLPVAPVDSGRPHLLERFGFV